MVFAWLLLTISLCFYISTAQLSNSIPDTYNNLNDHYSQALTYLSKIRIRDKQKENGFKNFLQYILLNKSITSRSNNALIPGSPLHSAVELLTVAANKGNSDAIITLADMNLFGNYSHPRNYPEAYRRYTQLASLNGNSSAQFMVGFFSSTGLGGVEKDIPKAQLYYSFAARQGNERAHMAIGYLHRVGIGAPSTCENSVPHYRAMARRAIQYIRSGPPGGNSLVKTVQRISDEDGGIYGEGASVSSAGPNARHTSPHSDANAASTDDVLDYLDMSARKGDLKATFTMGTIYYEGRKGLKPNYKMAKEYFLQVARAYWSKGGRVKRDVTSSTERLSAKAAGFLGRIYLRGEGVDQSLEIAKTWLSRGVSGGDYMSQYHLGLMYLEGLGVKKNINKAIPMISIAADQKYAPAQVLMGMLFLDYNDIKTATSYFELAARSENSQAFYYLGELALSGMLGSESCDLANHYFKALAEKAESILSPMQEANEAFASGDTDLALIDYMIAAEEGFEVAQTNVAYLIDKQSRNSPLTRLKAFVPALAMMLKPKFFLPLSTSDASLYWARSARQHNIDSMLKMGDYYYYGIGQKRDVDKAAVYYQTAAETLQSAQASWNIGWMYESGKGGLDQDYHLAKRYYDQALEINKESYLVVKLALFKLRIRSKWNEWTGGNAKSIQDERQHRRPFSMQEWLSAILQADAALHNEPLDAPNEGQDEFMNEFDLLTDEELLGDAFEKLVELGIMIGLALVLAVLVALRRLRQDRREANERRDERVQGPEANQNNNGDRGMFPPPGDPAVMDWAAGGIGH